MIGTQTSFDFKSITSQVRDLSQFFPNIGSANKKLLLERFLPKNAQGWCAVPRWGRIGKTYNKALERALELIKGIRMGSLCHHHDGRWMDLNDLQIKEKTKKAINILGIQQEDYDIFVFPCQLGKFRVGQTARKTSKDLFPWEFLLDPFSIACILLTHPEYFQDDKNPSIICPGAQYDRARDGSFGAVPSFVFYEDMIEFIDIYDDVPDEKFGPATGFLHEFYF